MSKLNLKDIMIPAAALVFICGISTALLAATNELTKEPIALSEEQTQEESMMSVLPKETADYRAISPKNDPSQCYEAYDKDGNVIAYAISSSSKGYGGTVKVMTGINAENGEILAVRVYDNSDETPGLGAKTSDDKFSGQFGGASAPKGFTVSKDADKNPEKQPVDAVTGATISSRAVIKAVNEAVEIYSKITGGER